MLKTEKQIKDWLNEHKIHNYTINDDLSVDVDGGVYFYYKNLTEIPIQFNKVEGNFYCSFNQLISLMGCPKEVLGYFYCSNNKLTSLIGAPKEVHGSFSCSFNKLTSLEHLPEIHGELVCDEYLHDTREYKIWQINYKLKEMV